MKIVASSNSTALKCAVHQIKYDLAIGETIIEYNSFTCTYAEALELIEAFVPTYKTAAKAVNTLKKQNCVTLIEEY